MANGPKAPEDFTPFSEVFSRITQSQSNAERTVLMYHLNGWMASINIVGKRRDATIEDVDTLLCQLELAFRPRPLTAASPQAYAPQRRDVENEILRGVEGALK